MNRDEQQNGVVEAVRRDRDRRQGGPRVVEAVRCPRCRFLAVDGRRRACDRCGYFSQDEGEA